MPPAVVVLGASGFLGQYVVEELTRKNEYHVVAVSHDGNASSSLPISKPSSTSSSTSSIVKTLPGDLVTGEGLFETLVEAAALGRDPEQEQAAHGAGHGLAAVVNCAAVSSPAECERDPERALAVNVPTKLVAALLAFARAAPSSRPSPCPCCRDRRPPLLVQLSTDQIYSGRRELEASEDEERRRDEEAGRRGAEAGRSPVESLWREEEAEKRGEDRRDVEGEADGGGSDRRRDFDPDSPAVGPLNAYARQKAEMELLLTRRYPTSVCLRSSVMYGKLPKDRKAVKGTRFLQFCDGALRSSAKAAAASSSNGNENESETAAASFFDDEWRSFVAVTDVAKAVAASVREWGHGGDGLSRDGCLMLPPRALNVGGGERLSRAQFARLVAEARRLDPGLVKAVSSSSVARAVPSPRDISMSVERLEVLLKFKPMTVAEALKEMPPEEEEEEEGEEA